MSESLELIPTLLSMAERASQQGQYEAAMQFIIQAKQAAIERQEDAFQADCGYYEGLVYQDAVVCIEEALASYQECGDQQKAAACLATLVALYQDLGPLGRAQKHGQEASQFYEQALAGAEAVDDRRNRSAWLTNLGQCYRALARTQDQKQQRTAYLQKVEIYLQQAITLARKIAFSDAERTAQTKLGQLYALDQDDFELGCRAGTNGNPST